MEAVRATTAEEPFFPSIDIGDANVTETFIHIGSQLNNPVKAVLEEAVSIFPGQCLSCVLSIGSGSRGINRLEPASATQLASGLRQLMNDGERISDEIAKDLDDKGVFYCRLDVDHGVEDIGFEDWERLGEVITHTQKYLEKHEVTQKVSRLVQVLNRRTGSLWFELIVKAPFIPIGSHSEYCRGDFNDSCPISRWFNSRVTGRRALEHSDFRIHPNRQTCDD